MADAKLDNLCKLLESIVVQHGGKAGAKNGPQNNTPATPTKLDTPAISVTPATPAKLDTPAISVTPATPAKLDTPAISVTPATPVKMETPVISITPATPVGKEDGEKSREEIEAERKARKEAKKAKKKGGGDEKEGGGGAKPVDEKENKAPKEIPKKDGEESKSKADLKRERREKQEAQRQAKAALKAQQEEEKKKKSQPQEEKAVPAKKKVEVKKRDKRSAEKEDSSRRIPLLGHLTPFASSVPPLAVNCDNIHPAVRTLAVKMKERVIDGSTARVVAMLSALKRVISDYRTPESCDLSRDLAEKLVPNIQHLTASRPLAIAVDNAVRFLKHKINSIKPNVPEAQAKDLLRGAIDDYITENVVLAGSTIASHAAPLLHHDDVILTFGFSALVLEVIEGVVGAGVDVSVVVADSPHPSSGVHMVRRLAELGVPTYYRLVTDITHIMHKVTKVVVEAEAVMMNGAVQGLCGTAGVALMAATHNTPFIVLCHTYKFSNNDLTDSLVVNELGDPSSIVSCPSPTYHNLLAGWEDTTNLNVVRLVYDVTPATLVTALVTEQSVLPTSAVPVIIRRNYADVLGQD